MLGQERHQSTNKRNKNHARAGVLLREASCPKQEQRGDPKGGTNLKGLWPAEEPMMK